MVRYVIHSIAVILEYLTKHTLIRKLQKKLSINILSVEHGPTRWYLQATSCIMN